MYPLEDSLSFGESNKQPRYTTDSDEPPATYTSSYEAVIQREVQKYRLSYLCSQSCAKICQYIKMRQLHGAQVYLVLFLLFLERLAYYTVVGNVSNLFFIEVPSVYRSLIQTALYEMAAQVMFPIAGFLGDHYIGRFRAAHSSMWLLLIGYVLLTFVTSFVPSFSNTYLSDDTGIRASRYLLAVCFLIITMGSAGFQANMIPFGADQIIGRPSDEISAYFFWYYCVRNLGASVFILSYICRFDYNNTVYAFVASISISLALTVTQFTQHRFFIDKRRYSPLKLVLRVIKFTTTVKRPLWRSAFSYTGVEPPSRIDLAKEIHGGRFTNVEVEDVKTFLRLLVFLVSLIGVLTVYTGVVTLISAQVKHMNGSFINMDSGCAYSESSTWFFNIGVIVVAIPFLNFCVFPLLREYTPNMLKRVGIGHFLAIASSATLLFLSSLGYSILVTEGVTANTCMFKESAENALPVSSLYIFIPHFTISLAEVFLIISSLEFFYAQSPHTMRGMMVGLFFFTWGVSTLLANLLVVFFSNVTVSVLTCGIWYYMILVVLAVVSFALYLCVSRWYRNRKRGDIEPDRYYRE